MLNTYLINMDFYIFILKLFLLATLLLSLGVLTFHAHETTRMEKRLGIALPITMRRIMRVNILLGAIILAVFTILLLY